MDANEPLPYYAGLAKVLHGPTLALVLTYLEFHHPAPQDPPESYPGAQERPVMLDCDMACQALGISRRTLHIALCCLGCWWGTEESRVRAARVDREFLNPSHHGPPKGHDPVKPYSVTGTKAWSESRSLTIRRNLPKLQSILVQAGIIEPYAKHINPLSQDLSDCARVQTVSTLPQILRSVLPNWSDRRAERWERWRRENGKKSRNPGRMRGAKIGVSSTDGNASDSPI